MKILVVEDHMKIRQNIIDFLKIKWHIAEGASNGEEALHLLWMRYDVIILDINMPIMNGEDFLRTIRQQKIMTPVLVLTSHGEIEKKVKLFELGADDYVVKPFDMRELEMRILAIARRKEKIIENEIIFANCVLIPAKSILLQDGKPVDLTFKEYAILEFLARHKGYPKTKTDILEAVWGIREAELNFDSITLEVHISSLRRKLGRSVISTMKGSGYFIA